MAPVTKVVYQEGDFGYDETSATYTAIFYVPPHVEYQLRVEVLQSDLGSTSEKITDIDVDGISFMVGDCNPPGDDYACTFYDCTPFMTRKTTSSATGIIEIDVRYTGHSKDCNCDKTTWECKDEITSDAEAFGSPMAAVARITLTPILESNDIPGKNHLKFGCLTELLNNFYLIL